MSDNDKQQADAELPEPDAVMTLSEVLPEVSGEVAGVEEVTPEPVVELPTQLPGEILAARRQEMRLSIEEVSTRLKLVPRQIAALEANDFAQLPGLASLRGFIRSYARLLELSPEPLIAMLGNDADPSIDAIVARRPLPSPGFSGRRYSPPTRHRSAAQRLSGLAFVILIFVGTISYVVYKNDWVKVPEIDIDGARSALNDMASHMTLPNLADPVESTDTAAAAVAVAPPSPESALQLKANQDAWVELIAVDGERKLVSKLMKAGTTELLEVNEPVVLVVGNAAGIEAVLRGQSLNLRAAARDNVVKLSLK